MSLLTVHRDPKEIGKPFEGAASNVETQILGHQVSRHPAFRTDHVYACTALLTLPHREKNGLETWKQNLGDECYIWEAGTMDGVSLGLPGGALARRILVHFISQGVRNEMRIPASASTLYSWSRGFSRGALGGKTYRNVQNQLNRIAACRLTIASSVAPEKARATLCWPNVVAKPTNLEAQISRERAVAETLGNRVFPIRRSALLKIGHSSTAIDLYIWLSSILPVISAPQRVDWAMIGEYFGAGYKLRRQMKPRVQERLDTVAAVYPEARFDIDQHGIILHPSDPPIAALQSL